MNTAAERIYDRTLELLSTVRSFDDLQPLTERIVNELLQRGTDAELKEKTLEHVRDYFLPRRKKQAGQEERLKEGLAFSAEVVAILIRVRRKRGEPQPEPQEIKTIFMPEEAAQSSELPKGGRATAPTHIILVPPAIPESHDHFDALFAAALRYRVGLVSTFFHRWNPKVFRDMPLPFMLAVPFGRNLDRVINELIVPAMLKSRAIRHIGTLHKWETIDSAAFWVLAQKGGHMDAIRKSWRDAWDAFRPPQGYDEAAKAAAEAGKAAPRIGRKLKALRQMLASDSYAIPEIRGRDIDLLATFLDPEYAREPLENAWTRLRQVYEQEMDRRIYQDKARSGALRDSLLACFAPFTNPTAEFLAMLCYWNFPYLSLGFLTAFTHNHGTNRAARLRRIPYLMWYLDLPGADEALAADERRIAESARREEAERKAEIAEEDARRRVIEGGTMWSKA